MKHITPIEDNDLVIFSVDNLSFMVDSEDGKIGHYFGGSGWASFGVNPENIKRIIQNVTGS